MRDRLQSHIYGTAAVLPALAAVGEKLSALHVQRAARWIVEHQNGDGGWGESCSHMDETLRGKGPSTASQTVWALMALIGCGSETYREPVQRGLRYLMDTQRADGTWDEPWYTGTGFPGYGVGERIDIRDSRNRKRLADA